MISKSITKVIVGISLLLVLILSIVLYCSHNDWVGYNFRRMYYSPKDFIQHYSYLRLSDSTEVLTIGFLDTSPEKTIDNEIMVALLRVPNVDIDKMFPEEERQYDFKYTYGMGIKYLGDEETKEKLSFYTQYLPRVRRSGKATDGNQEYMVLKPDAETTLIYVFIDYMGWIETNQWGG